MFRVDSDQIWQHGVRSFLFARYAALRQMTCVWLFTFDRLHFPTVHTPNVFWWQVHMVNGNQSVSFWKERWEQFGIVTRF